MHNLLAATKAFADPTRIRVIAALQGRELCVCELCDALGVVQSTLSTHLQYLRQCGLTETRNDGKWVYYRLSKPFARVADALFDLHRAELRADAGLRADAARLKKRLTLRDKGFCRQGFAKQTSPPRARKRNSKKMRKES